ncbi:MAG TPA: lycopene cyclase domain-containing protein [bacterium]|nr:lycopene cyclase domain-containing protein [bacterium]HNT64217.1 lycopene cyclase domain-containing protein [bacterium]
MAGEYLLFNLLVAVGPAILSFDRQVHYHNKWGHALTAAALVAPIFLFWDAAVTGRHWQFSSEHTLPFRLLGLPIEEWLFFLTVPFACLFVWEILKTKNRAQQWIDQSQIYLLSGLFVPAAVVLLVVGKEYTGLALLAFGVAVAGDRIVKSNILQQKRTGHFFILYWLMVLVCNGYLTARPVVIYDSAYQLGFRILTIPIEDFIYGSAHILLVLIVYEKLLARHR